ncbi:hypothetical protein V1512DRAFT_263465 [Lipomyces arxii]|uniref:uncharacterized protein n=1 Tax=Lipomyces arxii TaxID=56418 RepID=UPI0034CED85D
MKVAFIHPDLGIGGAERLVVDAAVGLQSLGHSVIIYTSRCDRTHCFEEIRDGILNVVVKGDTIVPRTIFGRFAILCAILRQLHLSLYILRYENTAYDAIFVDQLSFCIPLLRAGLDRRAPPAPANDHRRLAPQRRRRKARILFYCHFPDKLLAIRTSLLKKLYRLPFDAIEAYSTAQADVLLVNSRFTQRIFKQEFPSIDRTPSVVYPCVSDNGGRDESIEKIILQSGKRTILSVNRFERKKRLELAIRSYASLRNHTDFDKTALLISGGYDTQVPENVAYLAELQGLCDELNVSQVTLWDLESNTAKLSTELSSKSVLFLPSVSSSARNALLAASCCLAYTPVNEHFGIVPLEAMLMCVPVLATSSGGPLETVADGVTGWLRTPEITSWAPVVHHVLFEASNSDLKAMGVRGRNSVRKRFSRTEMATAIERAFLSASELESDNGSGADQQPAIMRTPDFRDAAWFAFLGWAVYYCKYGFAVTIPSPSEVLVGALIVLVVYYALF